jgi:3-oxosteroid 1-dehydrogenase
MTTWDSAVDVVIVGSGGGGMVAALAAADAGASALVLEKQSLIGGSTCMSGGIVWVPNNPVMQALGIPDSYADAMLHFETVVGDVGRCSSVERRDAFLSSGPEMVSFLQHLAVMTNEARSLSNYNRSPDAFAVSARVVLRTFAAKARGQVPLTNGASLIGQMLKIALDRGVTVWTDAPLDELIVEEGRVAGVRTTREGSPASIRARQGVLLAAGGFAHNAEMRQQYGGDQPNKARWSISNPGDTGEVLREAMRLGAQTDLMDEAWWLPSPRTGRFGQSTLDQARQRPRTIYVDAGGKRFVNESNSYMEVGKAMYARNKTSRAVPCWLIFDDRYRKRYAHQRSRPGRFPKTLLASGMLKQAWTLADLARLCDIDPEGLSETVERFNQHAKEGRDPDYGRGESAYNRALGDPNHKVHPCLGSIDDPPYYACEVVPGDIGTCGGVMTDEHARVIGPDDRPIPGLYATGNGTATVMGRHYLGPGASIANTMVFGYVAAHHATSLQRDGGDTP